METPNNLQDAFINLNLKSGDVVFCDASAVSEESICNLQSPSPETDNVVFVLVYVPSGKSVKDVVFSMSADDLRARLALAELPLTHIF